MVMINVLTCTGRYFQKSGLLSTGDSNKKKHSRMSGYAILSFYCYLLVNPSLNS